MTATQNSPFEDILETVADVAMSFIYFGALGGTGPSPEWFDRLLWCALGVFLGWLCL